MRVLFSALTPLSLTSFQSVIRELSARGHEVTVAIHEERAATWKDELVREIGGGVVVEHVPEFRRDRWLALARELRSTRDLFQFADPRYSDTYRARAVRRAPRLAVALLRSRWGRRRAVRGAIGRVLRIAESLVPTDPRIEDYLRRKGPDVVLFTPYLGLRTVQPDFLRAAQALGLRTAICVKSWDNLSSKSVLRPVPGRVFVWNEIQRREAEELHDVPRERVVVTGAQCFDEWFDWQPRDREAFCRDAGLDASRPYVLYVCSAPWTKETEVDFVRRWVQAFRAHRAELSRVGVMVRPHPKRPQEWPGADLSDLEDVVVYPAEASATASREAKAAYFDSIFHSAAVVGLNTSAMIEAAIVGRPVLTVLLPEWRSVQEETFHFRYLLEVGGGLLHVARSFDEHADQLATVIAGEETGRAEAFVREFIRPFGLDVSATGVFVDEVENLAATPAPRQRRTPAPLVPLRALLLPLAARATPRES